MVNGKLRKLFTSNFFLPTRNYAFTISIGVACSGALTFSLFMLFSGDSDYYYFLKILIFTWCCLRWINGYKQFSLILRSDKKLIYSTCFLTLITVILAFGLFKKNIPLEILFIVGLIDVILVSIFLIGSCGFVKQINFFLKGLFLGFAINIFTAQEFYPWLSLTSLIGMGHTDFYRDAALTQAWKNYGLFSYGTHGLMHASYHSLLAIFGSAFITPEVNIFKVFSSLNLIFISSLMVYGIYNILNMFLDKKYLQYTFKLTLFFIFTFSGFNYVQNQRSLQIATLIFISVLPTAYLFWFSKKNSNIVNFLLSISIPLMIFARVINGIIFASLVYPLIYKQKLRSIFFYIISLILSLSICLIYYDVSSRNSGINIINLLKLFLFYDSTWLISPWVLIGSIYVIIINKFSTISEYVYKFNLNISNVLILLLISSAIILIFKSSGYSDDFYILITVFYFLFFIVISKGFNDNLNNHEKNLHKLILLETINLKKLSIILMLYLSALYINHINKIAIPDIYNEIKQIRTFQGVWSISGGNNKLLDLEESICDKSSFQYRLCSIRYRIFGVSNFNQFEHSHLSLMAKNIDKLNIPKLNTAIYISPKNIYWSKFNNKVMPSLYFMALYGYPMIASINDDIETDFSFREARLKSGKLSLLSEYPNGVKTLCNIGSELLISNILIFEDNDINGKLISCNPID